MGWWRRKVRSKGKEKQVVRLQTPKKSKSKHPSSKFFGSSQVNILSLSTRKHLRLAHSRATEDEYTFVYIQFYPLVPRLLKKSYPMCRPYHASPEKNHGIYVTVQLLFCVFNDMTTHLSRQHETGKHTPF
ncbi:hypothetical protein E2C01_038914 [Portunus trituberculatus]|uniref:Uncharacterized protein n=1 Tax=Portunus trituberculatus TaxID=210409 RepID=A0A5B7FFF1_PORTR|nr:hypothetical protein [Portunus trituberculatus]